MDVREKLFTLFQDCNNPSWKWFPNNAEMLKLIDYLIAHGVTVQEWISVKDMLPKLYDKDSDWSVTVLFRTTQGHIHSGRRKFGRHRMSYWVDEADNLFFSKEEVTHWMPLPPAPKGE